MTRAKGKRQNRDKKSQSQESYSQQQLDIKDGSVVAAMSDLELLRFAEWYVGTGKDANKRTLGGLCHTDKIRLIRILPTIHQGGSEEVIGMRMSVETQGRLREARRGISRRRERDEGVGTGDWSAEKYRDASKNIASEVMDRL